MTDTKEGHPTDMQISNGVDLIRIERIRLAIERSGQAFLKRIWTDQEQADCLPDEGSLTEGAVASLAARFAAKEAVAKALGTGIGGAGVRWTEIEIRRKPDSRAPQVRLHGAALRRYEAMQGMSLSISLTHEGGLALAQCTILHQTDDAGEPA
jgi:holo-[acyl-carrier protein] synthase